MTLRTSSPICAFLEYFFDIFNKKCTVSYECFLYTVLYKKCAVLEKKWRRIKRNVGEEVFHKKSTVSEKKRAVSFRKYAVLSL